MDRHEVIAALQRQGITPTVQRVDIGVELFAKPQHLSADEVLSAVVASGRSHVSKATVYNTLNLFSAHGLLREVRVDTTRVYYDSNTDMHHHIFNVDTGELQDFHLPDATAFPIPALPAEVEEIGMEVIYRVRNRAL